MSRKTIIILAIPLIILTAAPLSLPETPEELKATGNLALQVLPELLKEVWRGFLDFFLTIWGWIKTFFNSYINPLLKRSEEREMNEVQRTLQNIWQNIWQERKEIVSQELEKEKQTTLNELRSSRVFRFAQPFEEIKALISKFPIPLWERIKAFIR